MTRSEKILFSFLCIIALLLIGSIVNRIRNLWFQPLGPSLHTSGATPSVLQKIFSFASLEMRPPQPTPEPAPASIALSPTEIIGQTPSPGACGGTTPTFILLIGSDTRANGYIYGLADVIRIARIDFEKPEIVLLDFPRDLWVEIPDIEDNLGGQSFQKLNQAYLYGNAGFGYTDDPAGGPGLLSRTLRLNFGARIDQYAAVNMATFEKIINAVGGIDVTLPKTVDGRTADDRGDHLLFLEGTHHLNGAEAIMLSRIRISGVFNRTENQTRVLCALRDKLTSPDIIPDIPKLIQAFQGSLQSSLSPDQLSQLACVGAKIEPNNIILTSFPQALFTQSRVYDPIFKKNVFVWDVDYDMLRDYTRRFNEGLWPSRLGAIGASNTPVFSQTQDTLFCE